MGDDTPTGQWMTRPRVGPPHQGGGDGGGDVAPTFLAALTVLESALAEANKRAGAALALADQLGGQLAGERQRGESALRADAGRPAASADRELQQGGRAVRP